MIEAPFAGRARLVKSVLAIAVMILAVPTLGASDLTSAGIGYICGAEQTQPRASPGAPVMLEGVGNGSSPADTGNPEAQAWYDEGLNLYHAFNHNEAIDAFARAVALDPNCALCEWGLALSLGPTLNYGVTPAQRATALGHAERARQLLRPDDDRAARLVSALLVRYGKDTPDAERDVRFSRALDEAARRYPADNEIANLTAHALLIPARRDDFTGVARAEELLKGVLARKPDDTAAIHYYIHASEFAGHAADALPYAERLAGLAPGASHLVHMAAHTLMHVGQYEEVALIDAQALKVDADVKARLGYDGPLSRQMYYQHNYSFGLAGALMAGDAALALKYFDHGAVAFPATFDQGALGVPPGLDGSPTPAARRITATARSLVALGRYAPARALAMPDRPDDPRPLRLYLHYARGEAFAARRDAAAVRREAAAIAALGEDARTKGETANSQLAEVAAGVLEGRAALLGGDAAKAAQAFAEATDRQERYFPFAKNFDPPPWWYPVRRSLAAAYLKAGRRDDAIREARASLAAWPNDALALRVLSKAEAASGQRATARDHAAQARRGWHGDLAKVPIELI